jgi:hypothetical protein
VVIIADGKLPIEWASQEMQQFSSLIVWFSLPPCAIWTAYKIFQFKSPAFGVAVGFLLMPGIIVVLLGKTLCGVSEHILYINQNNSSVIVDRSFGCGAWDSDRPKTTIYKKTRFLGIFYLKKKIDPSSLDRGSWIPYTDTYP